MCALELEPVLSTERLRLRRPRKADAQRIGVLLADREVSRMTTSIPHPYGVADAEAYLAQVDEADPQRLAMFVLDHPLDGAIGVIGFDSEGPARTELGYWLGRPYWGQGYATEAGRAALAWAHRDWKRRVVTAGHFADNPASGQVLVKLGFLYTGEVALRASKARGGEAPTRMMVWLA